MHGVLKLRIVGIFTKIYVQILRFLHYNNFVDLKILVDNWFPENISFENHHSI